MDSNNGNKQSLKEGFEDSPNGDVLVDDDANTTQKGKFHIEFSNGHDWHKSHKQIFKTILRPFVRFCGLTSFASVPSAKAAPMRSTHRQVL